MGLYKIFGYDLKVIAIAEGEDADATFEKARSVFKDSAIGIQPYSERYDALILALSLSKEVNIEYIK